MAEKQKTALSDKKMVTRAIKDSFIKLKPKTQAGNPVMLLVYLSAIMTTGLWLISLIFGISGCGRNFKSRDQCLYNSQCSAY